MALDTSTTSDGTSISKHSMSDESRRSLDAAAPAHNQYEIYPISLHSLHEGASIASNATTNANKSLQRTRTNQSELSRILTGIRDDQLLDEERRSQYRERGEAEYILAHELEKATTAVGKSRPHSVADVESMRLRATRDDKREEKREDVESARGSESDGGGGDEVDLDHRPDGGFAWLMAICAMLSVFSTWGANAAYGVFLNYYLNNATFRGATEYDYALIGGIVVCLANLLSPISVLLYKILGFKLVCCLGIIFQTSGWILASFATEIWHLYLTQGVLVGISFSLIFIPATMILPTWFHKMKAASMGTCVAGAGLGGLIFSLSLNKVIEDTGDQKWALRMVGLVCLATALFCGLLMRPRNYRLPSVKERFSSQFIKTNARVIFDIKVFKNGGIRLVALWFAIALVGYTLMLFSVSSYASSVGLSHSQASVMTAVMNAAQIVGRPTMGLTADRFGRANFTGAISLVVSIMLYAFWINARTYGSLIAFSVVIGLIIGVGSSLAQPLAADSLEGELEKLPAGWSGICIFVSFFCLVAEVIALSLVQKQSPRPYLHTQIFAGTCFFACFLLIFPLREFLVKKTLTERYNEAKLRSEKLASGEVTKSGYLKNNSRDFTDMIEEHEEDVLQERIARYEQLLQNSLKAYIIRMVYPIKV
ncbi:uncharacterized protein LODBEIA_P53810 [Lodderomyces beijingensis]|uniref:Major facilitator superfamily (MFS) profile domain-containing protein n=1 Tax=Lodderomyces beijingensis TaxID=1775926 RepID=A0ABP0ZSR9_9ASCO